MHGAMRAWDDDDISMGEAIICCRRPSAVGQLLC
jgi:hypothetical protein